MEQNEIQTTIIVIVALIIFIIPLLFSRRSKKKYKKSEEQLKETNLKLSEVKKEIEQLNDNYGSIIDMESHIENLLNEAEDKATFDLSQAENTLTKAQVDANNLSVQSKIEAEKLVLDANLEVINIKNESKELNVQANQKLKEAKEKVITLTNEGHEEAGRIIAFANQQAQEIAGDAYDAKLKADSYESAIRAMKNTIEGYNNDYIIPNHSVLDDLAEEFGFKDAGEQLKQARKRVKDMVKQGHAGDCDYVEAHRKTYAIHFAVDAFNGKVDSALAKVKHDNYGKIKQEIIDAFALVNHNGAPFRKARINQSFLDARQDELKWAVSTHELRQIELAEQREIKQQIREEEKARKEIEKAIKEAEKEEHIIQKALEKARSELANANEDQRREFESQLADLENKLSEAEAKGQRALSMAQQTRRGHVYVISNVGSFGENVFKIGMTRRLEPLDRVKELGDASVPFSFDVHAMLYSEDAPALEKELHRKFDRESVNKVNPRKEFFRVSLAEIKQMVDTKGITDIHWTMKAEAAEYRESIAIEASQLEDSVA
jgi:chromosome segregation ATPase